MAPLVTPEEQHVDWWEDMANLTGAFPPTRPAVRALAEEQLVPHGVVVPVSGGLAVRGSNRGVARLSEGAVPIARTASTA